MRRVVGLQGATRRLLVIVLLVCGLAPAWYPMPADAAGCVASLTLRMRAGVPSPKGMLPPTPAPALAPIPPGAVTIRVPLYPGAVRTTERETMPITGYPETPYLKVASATFRLPAAAGTGEYWYQEEFWRCGYSTAGDGQGDDAGGPVSYGMQFAARGNPDLTVELSFETVAGHNLVLYVAEEVTTPPRPAGSYLPADLVQVQIAHVLPLATGSKPVVYRTVTDPIALRPLVRAINALTSIDVGIHECPFNQGQWATLLIFQRRNGQRIRVYDAPGCPKVVVGAYPALWDLTHSVRAAITALVHAGGTPTPTANVAMGGPTPSATPR